MDVHTVQMLFYMYVHDNVSPGPARTENVSCGAVSDGGSENMRNVIIHWETNEEFPDLTSRYVVNLQPVDPPAPEIV